MGSLTEWTASSETQKMKRIVDDSLLYDTTIAKQFCRVCETLELGSNHGAIFNPKKFQFCRRGGICRTHDIRLWGQATSRDVHGH